MGATTLAPSLPSVLVRLKLRLLVNRSRTAKGGWASATLGALAAAGAGVAGFVLVAVSSEAADLRVERDVLVLGASALILGWTILPLVTFGTDETLDPARLVLFPLPRGPLMRGLLAASLVGFAPAAAALTVLGAVVGYGRVVGFPIVIAAGALLVLLGAATARTVTTLLASRLTSRRGRDALVIVGVLGGLAIQGVRFVNIGSIDPDVLDGIAGIARWFPPGMLGHAMLDAHRGRLAVALAELVPTLCLLPLLLVVWGRALERSLTVVTGGATARRRPRDERSNLPLVPRSLPFLASSPWGAVAAKELRYVGRDPRRKASLVANLVVGLGIPVYLAWQSEGGLGPGSVLLAVVAGYLGLLGAMNQFGYDGAALWLDVVAGNRVRDELVGKNVALAVQVVPVVLIASIGLAAVSGGWAYVPAALVLTGAGLGAGLGVANVVSVRYPVRLPEGSNPFAGVGGGQGCATGLVLLVCSLVQQVLLAPVAIAAALAALFAPAALIVVAPAGAGYGWLLLRTGLRMAERWAWWRQPELLLAVDPRQSG